MLERLEELEAKVLALVQLLHERSEQTARLERLNQELTTQLDAAEERLQQLEEERVALREQVNNSCTRETEIRDRLKGIIERIERFESQVSAAEVGGAE